LISFPRAASSKKCWIPSIKDKASEIWLADLGLAAKVCPVWIVSPHDPDSLRARGQDRLYLLWPLIDRLTPREAGLLRKPGHPLNELIDLCTEQRLPIAGLDRLDLIRGWTRVPILDCHFLGVAMNRESQIVRLATQHQIQGVDPDAIEQ
jgi:hypothetical protein